MAADAGTALQRGAASATLSLSLQGAPRFGRGMDRGGTVGRRIVSPHAHFAAPSFPSWGSARGGIVESDDLAYDLADFADPSAHGVPFARAIDLAAPEIWDEWARACAGVMRAEATLADEKKRRAEESALAKSQGSSLTLPWGMNDPVTAAIYHLDGAERRRSDAATAARESGLARLRAGEVCGFGRLEKLLAPWQCVLPREWQHGHSYAQAEHGVSILGGSRYWDLHLHDRAGLPLTQALVAYSRCDDVLTKIRAAPTAHLVQRFQGSTPITRLRRSCRSRYG